MHQAALLVLRDLGLRILLPEAREIFAAAGARVDEDMVFIGEDLVDAALASAPSDIQLRAPNTAFDQRYRQGALLFAPAGGCPNVSDAERGRRPGDIASYEETIKLCDAFDAIHLTSVSPEPQDVPINLRHLAMTQAQLTLGSKLPFVYARGRGQVEQSFELIRVGLDLSEEAFANEVWVATVINTNSPRQIDQPMAQGIIDFARAGQLSVITPFCLAGAMAPVTVAGALTLQHAECLAGMTLAQLAKPGAPVSYGGFSSNVDMKSGAPAFGTPEHVKMQLGTGQLARHIGLPWRSAAGSAAKLADAQGATENTMGLWGAMMAGATLIVHAAGWLEGGLTLGYEKFITDLEALQSLAELCKPVSASEAEIGLEALAEVEPGGHFFAAAHTMARYETAFYPPLNADLGTHGAWVEAGQPSADHRATEIWQAKLRDYRQPAHGPEVADRMAPLVEYLSAKGGAAPLD